MNRKWVVITQDNCPYCDKAKQLLRDHNETDVVSMNLKDYPDLKAFIVAQGLTTVPQVHVNGYRVGGADDLEEFLKVWKPL